MVQHYQLPKAVCNKVPVIDGDGWCYGFSYLLCICVVCCFASYVCQLDLSLQQCSMLVFVLLFFIVGEVGDFYVGFGGCK
jgi:hypothetical protein